jgi:hypothetical protein
MFPRLRQRSYTKAIKMEATDKIALPIVAVPINTVFRTHIPAIVARAFATVTKTNNKP